MFRRNLASVLALSAILLALAACNEDYPNAAAVRLDFEALADDRLPANVEARLITTYRGDGDSYSFSQIFVFDVEASSKVLIREGWLKGRSLSPDERARRMKVELVYHRKHGKWVTVGDGVI